MEAWRVCHPISLSKVYHPIHILSHNCLERSRNTVKAHYIYVSPSSLVVLSCEMLQEPPGVYGLVSAARHLVRLLCCATRPLLILRQYFGSTALAGTRFHGRDACLRADQQYTT